MFKRIVFLEQMQFMKYVTQNIIPKYTLNVAVARNKFQNLFQDYTLK